MISHQMMSGRLAVFLPTQHKRVGKDQNQSLGVCVCVCVCVGVGVGVCVCVLVGSL